MDDNRAAKRRKTVALQYVIAAAIGIAVMAGVCVSRGLFTAETAADAMKALSDGAFVSAAVLGGVGLLVFASNNGTFDIFVYGLQSLVSVFSKRMKEARAANFFEYRVAHESRRGSFAFLLVVGLVFLALAVVFTLLFYRYY